jgi:hypothetical protein
MSGEGVIPSIPETPFGRWHAGRNPRGATHPSENTRDVRVLHLEEPPTEDGAGFNPGPASSSLAAAARCPSESPRAFSDEVRL